MRSESSVSVCVRAAGAGGCQGFCGNLAYGQANLSGRAVLLLSHRNNLDLRMRKHSNAAAVGAKGRQACAGRGAAPLRRLMA